MTEQNRAKLQLRIFNDRTSLLTDENDPDINFYSNMNIDSKYLNLDEASEFIHESTNFSILSLNIRSLNKNIDNFRSMLGKLKHTFKVICLTESWCKNDDAKISKFDIKGYKPVHQPRKNGIGGGICVFVHESLKFKHRKDLNKNCEDCESLSIEIIHQNTKNSIVTTLYRPPVSNFKQFKKLLKDHISKSRSKRLYIAGDFNINLLNYEIDLNIANYVNTLIQHNVLPLIDKPTRITRRSETLIDNILTNTDTDKIKSGIILTDISDHLPIFMVENRQVSIENEITTIYKRQYSDGNVKKLRELIQNYADWELIKSCKDAESAYNLFIRIFSSLYDEAFPKIERKIKTKYLKCPWMTRGLLISSKKKQRLYEKFLKKKTVDNERKYKNYKKIFENTKKKSKVNYYSNLLQENIGNSKKTWDVIKEVTGKKKANESFPNRIKDKGTDIYQKREIAEKFNSFYVNLGKNLAEKIEPCTKNFESYLKISPNEMPEHDLSLEELKKAFSSLKPNKSEGIDEIHVNIIKTIFEFIEEPLHFIFNLSLKQGIFPNELKIAKVIPLYKKDEDDLVSNYRPVSILPCFSKILERIVYNRLYDHLMRNDLLYQKQFGFQNGHSTEHAVVDLVDKILKGFDQNNFTLGVFIDLSKAFDTVNHKILIRKLELYGVKNSYLKWFQNYLSDRKQGVSYPGGISKLMNIVCGIPQGSILGPLLFLIYVNDLYLSSKLLNCILFADDTNLFLSGKNIKTLFSSMNSELSHITDWLKSNKLSINISKTQYILFMKPSQTDSIPLKLPNLTVNSSSIKRVQSTKFLGVIIDQHVNWKEHINLIKSKVSKNLGVMYKAKDFLNQNCLKKLYFSFIHAYINYCNIAWASNFKTYLKKLYTIQKKASRIIMNKHIYAEARPLMKRLFILNVYQLNLFQTVLFMFKLRNNKLPKVFQTQFSTINHKYPTRYSHNNYYIPRTILRKTDFALTHRGPTLWNKIPSNEMKNTESFELFKSKLKQQLLDSSTETTYF